MLRFLVLFGLLMIKTSRTTIDARPHRILMDTDMNMDDIFALFYVLKQNRSEFNLQAITINTNGWSNAGHAVNHLYDILYMMDRDHIPVGVGGEGGILPNATILPNVGGYLPIIDQDISTAGDCRYRQAIPVGSKGRLDVDTSYGIRKKFLPQANRRYIPLEQPTAQQVMIDTISAGSTVVFIMGAHTNLAIFLMNNPHLKRNIEHIYVMGGAVRPNCRDSNGNTFSKSGECKYPGNLFPGSGNPYAEFNIFADPFAAYQVLHSGIPITIVPLDATNSVPIHESFFTAFEKNQNTYEAQYCFQSLKLAHDTWFDSKFHENFFMWDSFMAGVAISAMRNADSISGENEFAIMEYMNITVITSNEPYGTSDDSNPLFNGRAIPKFNLQKNGVHSGHVQTGMRDPFCFLHNGQGKCEDGYTKEVTGLEAVRVLVAREAKKNDNKNDSFLDKKFYRSFLDVMNNPRYAGRFNISTQFPHYKQISYSPGQKTRKMGKPVVFDMDMSPGDFLVLFYLLKLPVELIDLKGVLVSATGWANGGTIDVVYDVLHMMGRDDIPVGLGDEIATGQEEPSFHSCGNCKYRKAIPHGAGGFLDTDTLYGLARDLPRSPRRYTAENSVTFGAPRDTDHPELRQPSALDVWKSIISSMDTATKISLLTSGPLTNLAEIILLQNASSMIQDVHIVGGHTRHGNKTKGNLFTVSSNEYAEFNMFLDPMAAKVVLESDLDITLIPVEMQREVSSFKEMLDRVQHFNGTPEVRFVQSLLSKLWKLQGMHQSYHHMDIFLGEVLGGVVFSGNRLNQRYGIMPIRVFATGDPSTDGEISVDEERGRRVKVLDNINPEAYYDHFARVLGDKRQSAVIASFDEQKRVWSSRP